jgi:hypothetical protein
MDAIFLSASVPIAGRGSYHETANPFLIQCAVRELVISVIRTHRIVWGGHPSITPMIWSICEDLDVNYANSVVLYQSRFFKDRFPEENARFGNVVFTDEVSGDREASLSIMRQTMLGRNDLIGAVLIGGMDGVEAELAIFQQYHPNAFIVPVGAGGGAARDIASRTAGGQQVDINDVDFARIFHRTISHAPAINRPGGYRPRGA